MTQAAWRRAGVELPRTTWTQWGWGSDRRVPLDQLEPGDLLFSKGLGHMGMYAGNGKMVAGTRRQIQQLVGTRTQLCGTRDAFGGVQQRDHGGDVCFRGDVVRHV
ncbi:C40 family peptidase [Nonomuraea sp. CA-141351]|uniref:C40 family peptidase n=1 Tax=Nonomuraea sp. CA-141351 TaxID=3239996 RepID=UPI003D8B6959